MLVRGDTSLPQSELYYLSYQHSIHGHQSTYYPRRAVFIDTSPVELSHWLNPSHMEANVPAVEELIIMNQDWIDDYEEKECVEAPRLTVLPYLKSLRVSGFLPDICVLFDMLQLPNLEYMEVVAYYGGPTNANANEGYLDWVANFQDRCGFVPGWITIGLYDEPEPYDFGLKGVFSSLANNILASPTLPYFSVPNDRPPIPHSSPWVQPQRVDISSCRRTATKNCHPQASGARKAQRPGR